MQYEQNNIRENRILISVFTIIQIIFIVLLIVSFRSINQDSRIDERDEQPEVVIEDLSSSVEDLPAEYITDLQHSLTEAIELNNSSLNIPGSKAVIRAESITTRQFDEGEFNALSLIVDIPNLEQSYQIYYKYPTNSDQEDPFMNNPRAVLCL